MYIPLPDLGSRLSIFNANLRKSPLAPDVDIDKMAEATQGFSGADISEICQRAAKNAIRESIALEVERAARIEAGEVDAEEEEEDPVPFITKAHFEEAMSRARKSVSEADIRKYDAFNAQMKSDRGYAEFKFDEAGEGGEEGGGEGGDDDLY